MFVRVFKSGAEIGLTGSGYRFCLVEDWGDCVQPEYFDISRMKYCVWCEKFTNFAWNSAHPIRLSAEMASKSVNPTTAELSEELIYATTENLDWMPFVVQCADKEVGVLAWSKWPNNTCVMLVYITKCNTTNHDFCSCNGFKPFYYCR